MIIQLLYFSLMLGMFSTYAADDQLLRITMDETPEGYMRRLRADEAGVIDEIPGTFIFERDALVSHVQTFMKTNGLADYFDYFEALASTKKLSDIEKIEPRYVEIPPIKALRKKTKEERQLVLNNFLVYTRYVSDHSFLRLLVAPLCSMNVNLNDDNNDLFNTSLLLDDVPLIQKLLQYGVNQNIKNESLACCKSSQAAQLCLQYGCNFDEQCKQWDLIGSLCQASFFNDKETAMLSLFLIYVKLKPSNQYGKEWFELLKIHAKDFKVDTLIERIAALLKAGCLYDEQQIRGILDEIDKKDMVDPCVFSTGVYEPDLNKEAAKEKIAVLVKQDRERRRIPRVVHLKMRALTGKQFGGTWHTTGNNK